MIRLAKCRLPVPNRSWPILHLQRTQNPLLSVRFRHGSGESGLSPRVPRESLQELISDVNHYLRTTEIAENLRRKLLQAKCEELIVYGRKNQLSFDYFRTLNRVFVYTRKKNDDIFSSQQLHELFNNAVRFYLGQKETVPQFVHLLAAEFVKQNGPHFPTLTLVNIVRLGAHLQSFKASFSHVQRLALPEDFLATLLNEMKANGELNLDVFKVVLDAEYVNDDLVRYFVQYVEELFHEQNPNIHEYLDQERNVYRIQETMNHVMAYSYSVDANVALLSLKASMNSVLCGRDDIEAVNIVFNRIAESKEDFQLNEDSIESFLLEALERSERHPAFFNSLCNKIQNGNLSEEVIAKMEIVRTIVESGASKVEEILQEHESAFTFTVQALCRAGADDTVEKIEKLSENLHHEFVLDDYKYMIDYVTKRNPLGAYEMFEKSTKVLSWRDSIDPSVARTLNQLILGLAEEDVSALHEMFHKFKKIKQNHPSVCDAEALRALSKRMLDEQCVGDVIELLKRELPKIDKDSIPKIMLEASYCQAHSRLFSLLHDFVLNYDSEKTYETNWVLYGELHKYFQVPHHTYLPTIQFFCSKNRLNAALLICRRMKMLSDLHGAQNANLPPSREIYMYLFEVFGDKLYEEGVTEVHEFLKMDTALESSDVELQNCLMNAYSNLQDVAKAHDLFLSMSANSKESGGINERTAQIMLKTFTYSDMSYVRRFWNSLSEYGVFPNHDMFKQYLIAHSYYGLIDEAIELTHQADEFNLAFSPDMLLAMHNYCFDAGKQQEIAQWASQTYPEEWNQLKQSRSLITASEYAPEELMLEDGKDDSVQK